MLEFFDFELVNWSRGQFALTAMFHWLFVPLTLGLSFMLAFMETIYYRTRDEEWKRITKFWMKIFGINFAIGVATGIILEFEFGTNWSNYSWFVGDIFGAPLAIEGIMAFFMESTFIAVMFFGWNKVSPKFHLASTWLTAVGANLSALWILVANGWMQNPVGMKFNPDTARNEMQSFWDVVFSDTAVSKFLHTTTSSFVVAAIFVVGISCWFLIKRRHELLARRSIIIASVFGVISSIMIILTGDIAAREISKTQPMKFAAMEALYEGQEQAPLIVFGIISDAQASPMTKDSEPKFMFKFELPYALSFLAHQDINAYVPGIKDLVLGNADRGIMSYADKIRRGHEAQTTLRAMKEAQKNNNDSLYTALRAHFEDEQWIESTFKYFGYGSFYSEDPEQLEKNAFMIMPNIPITFYSFHIMVILGMYFLALFALLLWMEYKDKLMKNRWLFYVGLWTIPLSYIATQTGWLVAEMGRQPWVIQDLMSTLTAVSQIDTGSVKITFWLFAFTFVGLAIAEVSIMVKQIKNGPKEEGGN